MGSLCIMISQGVFISTVRWQHTVTTIIECLEGGSKLCYRRTDSSPHGHGFQIGLSDTCIYTCIRDAYLEPIGITIFLFKGSTISIQLYTRSSLGPKSWSQLRRGFSTSVLFIIMVIARTDAVYTTREALPTEPVLTCILTRRNAGHCGASLSNLESHAM